jgi:CheY-like chemotaxis protein
MQAVVRKAREVSQRVETDMRHLFGDSSPGGTTGHGPHRRTVLVVENDLATRVSMKSWLSFNDFSVRAAVSGSEAVQHLDDPDRAIDAVVVDLGLRDVSGTALCEVIHRFHPSLPIVACSGLATPGDVRRVMRTGVQKFVPKPVDPDELVAAVKSAIT